MRTVGGAGTPVCAATDGVSTPRRSYLSQEQHRFEAAIQAARGNITQAAVALAISKGYAMVLVKRFGLTEWARKIRAENGIATTGYPRGRPRQPYTSG
jgi:hypothetical protein